MPILKAGQFVNESSLPAEIVQRGGGWFTNLGAEIYVCRGAHMLAEADENGRDCRYGWQVKEIRGNQKVPPLIDAETAQLKSFRLAADLAMSLNACGDAEAPELVQQVDHVLAIAKIAFTKLGLRTTQSAFALLNLDTAESFVPCLDLEDEDDLFNEDGAQVKEWDTCARLQKKPMGAVPCSDGDCVKCGSKDSLKLTRRAKWQVSVTKDGFAQVECQECGHLYE